MDDRRDVTWYLNLLDRIHVHLLPRTYVEVGVQYGKSMQYALPGTNLVGIDPAYEIKFPIPPSAQLFKLTSADFFSRHDLGSLLGGLPVDLALIDGMHLFEYALQDFIALEKSSAKGSVVLVHDCYPMDRESASRTRTTKMWTGDVWKLIPCLKEYRPDLLIGAIDVPPSGLGVITDLDPSSTVLDEHYDEICKRFIELDYDFIEDEKASKLNRIPNSWDLIADRLPRQAFRRANVNSLVQRRRARFLKYKVKQRLHLAAG